MILAFSKRASKLNFIFKNDSKIRIINRGKLLFKTFHSVRIFFVSLKKARTKTLKAVFEVNLK